MPAIGAMPPEVSPSIVAYPTAASERLLVETSRPPVMLASIHTPGERARAWMFCSATSSRSQVSGRPTAPAARAS
jgi:hypothetical protein